MLWHIGSINAIEIDGSTSSIITVSLKKTTTPIITAGVSGI